MDILDFTYMLGFRPFSGSWPAIIVLGLPLLHGCSGFHRRAPDPVWTVSREVGVTASSPVPAVAVVEPGRPAGASAPRGAPALAETPPAVHVVEPGQTMWRIAAAYHLSVDQLARANGIADPARIDVGRELRIPGARRAMDIPERPQRAMPATRSRGASVGRLSDGEWAWPVRDGRILSYFGAPRTTHRHAGLDIFGPRGGPVVAARAGTVVYSNDGMRGYGKTIILDHGDGVSTLYAHNSKLLVHEGQRVRTGEPIATIGRTGDASIEHCHFEIRRNQAPMDPLRFLVPEVEARR